MRCASPLAGGTLTVTECHLRPGPSVECDEVVDLSTLGPPLVAEGATEDVSFLWSVDTGCVESAVEGLEDAVPLERSPTAYPERSVVTPPATSTDAYVPEDRRPGLGSEGEDAGAGVASHRGCTVTQG